MSKFQKDLTRGSVARHLVLFSIPFLAANFLQALYNMADMFFVGRFNGAVGATAVGVGGQVTVLMMHLISGLAVGGTVLIAQYIGAGRQGDVKRTVGTIFTLYSVAGAALTAVMLVADRYILRLLVSDPLAYPETLKYTNICMAGLIFIFGYNAVSAVLRGMGDSRHPLLFVSIAAALNIGLDALFCGPFGMGAAGAAWATVISQGVSFLLSVWFLRRKKFLFDFHPKSFRVDKEIARQLLRIGLPTSAGGVTVALSFIALTGVADSIAGLVGTTALSVTGKVNSVAILPALALQASTASMAGQNLGAQKYDRALKTCLTAVGLTLCVTVPMLLLARAFAVPVTRFFLGTASGGPGPAVAAECVAQSAVYIRSISWDYIFVAGTFNVMGLAMAAGHTKFTLSMSLLSSIVMRVPAAWLLGKTLGLGLMGLGLAVPATTALCLLIEAAYLYGGRWKRSRVVAGPEIPLME
ncbi:MAG: MATE family efflux transporter [Oscillospiraceae bacterium]|jgi:putative MATE family efflux protein|nr:MATE family efflux transporter [Oscillospiraceae bacterium]